jgi:glutathione S-transferase
MIVYGMSMSPYVRKALAFAGEKGVELECRDQKANWPKGEFDPEFLKCSPFAKIPALCDGDFSVSDSSAIVAYLDALRPEPELIPEEPQARARTVWFDEFADTIAAPPVTLIFANRVFIPRFFGRKGDDALASKAETEQLPPILNYLQTVLPPSGFLVEDRLTLADLAVVSALANMRHCNFDFSPWPDVHRFFETVFSRPCFARGIERENAVLSM